MATPLASSTSVKRATAHRYPGRLEADCEGRSDHPRERSAARVADDLDERLSLVEVVGGDQRGHLLERGHERLPGYGGRLGLAVDLRTRGHQRGERRQRVGPVHPEGVQRPRRRVATPVMADLVEVDAGQLLL